MSSPDGSLPPTAPGLPAGPDITGSYYGLAEHESAAASQPAEQAGAALGPYHLLRPVRACRNGTVYEARHPRLGRTVPVRVLEGAAARAEFARLVRDLSGLAHPNVAGAVLEASLDGPTPFVALENSPGTALGGLGPRGWLERQKEVLFPNRRLGQALLDAARGLAAVHQAGLAHGNLRPEALRVDADGRVLLAGLGDDEATVPEAAPFAAPASLGLTESRQRDLYALGASFYFLVTGMPPACPPLPARRLNPGVERSLSEVLARCLRADPAGCYASADELAATVEQALQTEAVPVPWGKRVLLTVEGILVVFAGAAIIALVAKLGFGYQESEDGTFAELMVLAAPGLLYWIVTEFFLGRTLLRLWQGFEVTDLSGDPARTPRRCFRAAVKIGLLAGWCVGFGWFYTAAVAEGPAAVVATLINGMFLLLGGLYGFPWLLLQYRRGLGEPLSGADVYEAGQLLPHDRLTGTRLVIRRPAVPLPVPAAPASREVDYGPFTERLDQYNLGPRLGAGGMGTVYRAWDRVLARPTAVKVLGDQFTDRPPARERFEREARLAAQLNHPNIAKVYGVGEPGGRPYIAMELVEGETLQERARRQGPLPVAEAWGFALQAAEALRAAGELGIVHRDIKPSNLMVTPQGVLKVTDFGVSRQTDGGLALTETGAVVGTPLYMSPEQATGKAVDGRSDQYSLGMTLYFLLTGRTAFAAQNPMDLLAQQLAGSAPSLAGRAPGLTDGQAAVVDRMLARRPQDRFPDYAALLAAFRTESPEQAPAAPVYFRFADGVMHLACCVALLSNLFLVALFALPVIAPAGWQAALHGVRLWTPGLVLVWQCLATLVTVLVVVYRPPIRPYHPEGTWPPRELLRHLGNKAWAAAVGLLLVWPALHHSNGLRVIRRDGRRLRPARALLRFAAGYPFLLPWAALALLTGLSVPALAVPIGLANLGLLAVSAVVLLLHPERRNLADLIAGTREVRVPPPVLCRRPTRAAQPVRPIWAAARAAGVFLLVAASWGACGFWLHSLREQERSRRLQAQAAATQWQAEARQRLQQFEDDFIRGLKVTRVQARLMTIGAYYVGVTKSQGHPNERDLAELLSADCLVSPRGGKILVLWGVVPAPLPEQAAGQLLAYEQAPDGEGKRYVLTANGLTRYVGEAEFLALLRAAGR